MQRAAVTQAMKLDDVPTVLGASEGADGFDDVLTPYFFAY